MTTKTIKKALPKLPIREEDAFARTVRLRLEKEAKDIMDAKNKIKYDKAEKERQAKIIRPYLERLEAQVDEKNLRTFFVFPDRTGFKKIHMNVKEMKKFVLTNVDKYKNRPVVFFTISFHHDEPDNSLHRKFDIWMGCGFTVFYMDDNCRFDNPMKPAFGGHYMWKTEDFKTTKFSLKLIEEIMYPVVAKKTDFTSLLGYRITEVITILKKIKVDLSDILNPLAGV